ncbi:acidic leucine-rich nuclear phosphoprotein 32 family member E-like [Capsella rubella]|uniref:acidic leucine-rich nuclear phosphoprotein 32 family member E-like n=1 Tax=Capsella rubella TaxID=81985 RepID=UPI000CD5B81D|nr:acidic leucine-rich nuclear phosphoprotein 32 family member E-like [Capsella rubella]
MEGYSTQEEESYDSSSFESEKEDTNQSWFDEEDEYDATPWPHGDYSRSDYSDEVDEDEPEQKPPDHSLDAINYQGCNEEEAYYEETDSQSSQEQEELHHEEEERLWCEIPYSDHEEDHQGETESQFSLEEFEASFGDRSKLEEEFDEENEAVS